MSLRNSNALETVIVGALLTLGVFVVAQANDCIEDAGKPSDTSDAVPAVAAERPWLSIGDVGAINPERSVFGFDSRDAFEQSVRAVAAHDTVGLREVVMEHGTELPANTKVLVVDVNHGARRIRLQGGAAANSTFWVAPEDLVAIGGEK